MENKEIHNQTIKELNTKIMAITMLIQEKHPELLKYLNEMTVTIPFKESPEITVKTLSNYYNSLETIVNDYKAEHPEK